MITREFITAGRAIFTLEVPESFLDALPAFFISIPRCLEVGCRKSSGIFQFVANNDRLRTNT
jgi:hypothetical protein